MRESFLSLKGECGVRESGVSIESQRITEVLLEGQPKLFTA